MLHNWIKALGAVSLAATFYAIPANAAMPSDWDKNADAGLTRDEFDARFTAMGVFEKWDTDKDGKLTQAEWTAAMGTHGDRFKTRFGGTANADPFMTWNTDGTDGLTEQEFYQGAYSGYDANRDNKIQETEFGPLGEDIGPSGFWVASK